MLERSIQHTTTNANGSPPVFPTNNHSDQHIVNTGATNEVTTQGEDRPLRPHYSTDMQDTDNPPGLTTLWDSDSDDDDDTITHDIWHPSDAQHPSPPTTPPPRTTTEATTYSPYSHTPSSDDPLPHMEAHNTSPSISTSTRTPILIPTQVITATPALAPLAVQGLTQLPIQTTRASHENFYIGDILSLPKSGSTTQVYFQNVNGINVTAHGNWGDICEHLRNMEVDIALLAEHKLDTTQPRVTSKLHDTARRIFGAGTFSIQATSTAVESPTMYKPGGILSMVNGGVKGRVLASAKDPYGRWTSITLRRTGGPPLTIIVTYQVVNVDPRSAGPTTYATQLYAQYTKEGRPNPQNLRQHHADDLVNCVQAHQNRGEWIIVTGDLNEVLGVETGGLTQLHTECTLVDAYLQKHGQTDFSTYQRGTHVIDYILVDHNVYQCTQAIGYEPFGLHILSDHRGIFLDIATAQCFGSNLLPLQPIQLRDLSMKRSHQLAPYFHAKHKHLEDHNWYKKVDELHKGIQQDISNHAMAENLYERLISALIYARSKLKKFPPAPYSPCWRSTGRPLH